MSDLPRVMHGVGEEAHEWATDACRPLNGGGTMLRLLRRLDDAEVRAHGCHLVAHGYGVYMYVFVGPLPRSTVESLQGR